MVPSTRLAEKLKLKDFKLNALLDITRAINANLSVPELLERYKDLLREQLSIDKLVLFTRDKSWRPVLQYGIEDAEVAEIADEAFFTQTEGIKLAAGNSHEAFDLVIPVLQNDLPIAYLLVGDLGEQTIGISPAIKHMNFVQTLTNVLVVAIENRKLQEENLRQELVKRDLDMAAEMQAILLPNQLPKNENYEVSAVYRAHQQVGGDYYDFMRLNEEEVMFCMADVSGKGLSAAFLMANFQANLRAIFTYNRNALGQMIHELNECVMNSALGEKYITLFIGIYNCKTREMQYANCGHSPPVIASDGYTQLLKLGTIGLGMFEHLPKLAVGNVHVPQGSVLVCFTDGLVETENANNQAFSTERVEKIVLSNHSLSMAELNNLILSELNAFRGDMPFVDDLALMSCRFY